MADGETFSLLICNDASTVLCLFSDDADGRKGSKMNNYENFRF